MIKTLLLGTLGADAELNQTKTGTEVARFSVAVNKRVKTEVTTVWVKCSLFGARAPKLQQYLTKGTKVFIEGEPSVSTWTNKDGKSFTDFNVMVSDVQLLGGQRQTSQGQQSYEVTPSMSGMPAHVTTLTDEDVPF